jgi:hypothetical protein
MVGVLALMSYGTLGNFAAFFEIATAVHVDGKKERIRLLPFTYFGFIVSVLTITLAAFSQVGDVVLDRKLHWDKTPRYRRAA